MSFLADSQIETIKEYKRKRQYNQAIKYVNQFLMKEPTNDELLLEIADLQYRKGEIDKAAKAVDFMNDQSDHQDPMWLYVKGVLEMEKSNWNEARSFLLKATEQSEKDNHEIMRCYGLSEYWYGNREKWLKYLENAHDLNKLDAEIIYNLVELYLLEHRYRKAARMISYFQENKEGLEMYEKKESFYRNKIVLFSTYIDVYEKKRTKKTI